MENLIIEETKYTPKINLNVKNGLIAIIGKSYPENTFDFYTPVMRWLKDYFNEHSPVTATINMDIIYFNSSSAKLFFDLFDILDKESEKGSRIRVNWLFEEENQFSQEAGEDYKEDFENLNIIMVKKLNNY